MSDATQSLAAEIHRAAEYVRTAHYGNPAGIWTATPPLGYRDTSRGRFARSTWLLESVHPIQGEDEGEQYDYIGEVANKHVATWMTTVTPLAGSHLVRWLKHSAHMIETMVFSSGWAGDEDDILPRLNDSTAAALQFARQVNRDRDWNDQQRAEVANDE